jgi:gamma-glutamylcyclotransferase (GGCT)/AIG2-like uncharacterized protein YtfP
MWPFRKKIIRNYTRGVARDYTPDILDLERRKRVCVFVYDDMKMGGKLHEYVQETSITGRWPLYTAYTVDPFYVWRKDLGEESFPVALADQVSSAVKFADRKGPARIEGEVYCIRPSQIVKLDFLRENGLQFFRKEVDVYIPHSKVIYSQRQPLPALHDPARQTFPAFIYIGNGYYWDQQLGGVLPSSPLPQLKHIRAEIGTFTRFDTRQQKPSS